MKTLFILNDPPYGTERCYNALRLASALMKKDAEAGVTVFLMADAVIGAKAGQKTPEGYYSVERMLRRVLTGKGQVLLRHLHGCPRFCRRRDHAGRTAQHDGCARPRGFGG